MLELAQLSDKMAALHDITRSASLGMILLQRASGHNEHLTTGCYSRTCCL